MLAKSVRLLLTAAANSSFVVAHNLRVVCFFHKDIRKGYSMDIFDNEINKRIVAGFFPTEKLYPAVKPEIEFDLKTRAQKGLKIFSEKPELFDLLLACAAKTVEQLETLQDNKYYSASFNSIINSNYSEDYLCFNGSFQVASSLIPVVTQIDKALWCAAYSAFMESKLRLNNAEYDPSDFFFAWIYLLVLTQQNEIEWNRTLEFSIIGRHNNLLKLFLSCYDESLLSKKICRNLTQQEITDFSSLINQRESLTTLIREERVHSKNVAKRTKKEWALIIDILNDLSRNEANVIQTINKPISGKDKIKAIKQYNRLLSSIEHGKYYINGKWFSMLKLIDALEERTQCCYTCTCVKTDNSEPFIIHPAAFLLMLYPHTYNYIFISFHLFRMEPTNENASRFISMAVDCINRNLNYQNKSFSSLDEMIKEFYSTVKKFMESKRQYLDKLSFGSIQQDAAVVEGSSLSLSAVTDMSLKQIEGRVNEIIDKNLFEDVLAEFLSSKADTTSIQQMVNYEDEQYEIRQNEAEARNIIYSLNLIYLFCEAVRIILLNPECQIENRELVSQYRRELLKIDDELVHKVYAHMDDQEIDMLEYRERTGLIYSSLSEQELQAEKLRNSAFSITFKGIIDELTTRLEEQDIDGILQVKNKVKKEISRFPDCDDKYLYAEWLDSISVRISDALINNCQKQKDDYLGFKNTILRSLGDKSALLPSSAVDSLTTAEMLFTRYANDDFASNGFDYSCISALYYQAFEDAYSDLIWSKYAAFLNALIVGSTKYTDILERCRNSPITVPAAQGYLMDNDSRQRGYYISYRNRTTPNTTVSMRCMYKSFAIIMEQLKTPSDLNGFCEFIAQLCGFAGRINMFSDTAFMQKCHDFTDEISRSADNRNNASHGGSFISLGQCTDDKKTVLNNLESIRRESIGLIQQLLYILQKD